MNIPELTAPHDHSTRTGASRGPRLAVFAVSGVDLDAPALAARLAQLVGSMASVVHWSGEGQGRPAVNEHCGFGPAVARLRVVVATREARVFAAAHRQLSGSPIVASLHPVADPADLHEQLRRDLPQALLLDESLFSALDPATLQLLREQSGAMHVLLLCASIHAGLVGHVLAHGLHGCLETDAPPDGWAKALAAVRRGELWLPRALLQKAAAPRAAPAPDGLTPREAETVALVREGLSNKQIAQRLGVREDTVKKHLHNVFAKLGVCRRTQVAVGIGGTGSA